jgi:hypothetical protein
MRVKHLLLCSLQVSVLLASAEGTSPLADRKTFDKKLMEFNEQYYFFTRDYFGCPYTDETTARCTPTASRINWAAYTKAAKLSKEIFPQQ